MAEQKKPMPTEQAASSGATALLEAPAVVAAPQFEDSDDVIVLYGYGRVAPTDVEYVDGYRFVGGVARDVPYVVARCWQKHNKPDGSLAPGRVKIQAILPANATEADFVRATGITPLPMAQMAALLNAADPEAIIAAMGAPQAKALADELRSRIAARQSARQQQQ